MSYTITDAEIRKFDSDVKGIYQSTSRLGGVFNKNNAAGASSYQVVRLGYGMGTRSVAGAQIPGMGSSTDKTIIQIQNWNNAEYIDYFQQDQVNWAAVSKAAKEVCAPAAGRRYDQIVIDELDSGTFNEIAADFGSGSGNVGITNSKVQRANSIMSHNAVPQADRFMIAPYLALEEMLSTDEFISSDYVKHQLNSAQKGEIVFFGGFNWIFMANNPEGGLSYTEDGTDHVYDCYATHRRALEIALGSSNMGGSDKPMTTFDKVPNLGSWIVNAPLACGAGVVETAGIVRVKAAVTPLS